MTSHVRHNCGNAPNPTRLAAEDPAIVLHYDDEAVHEALAQPNSPVVQGLTVRESAKAFMKFVFDSIVGTPVSLEKMITSYMLPCFRLVCHSAPPHQDPAPGKLTCMCVASDRHSTYMWLDSYTRPRQPAPHMLPLEVLEVSNPRVASPVTPLQCVQEHVVSEGCTRLSPCRLAACQSHPACGWQWQWGAPVTEAAAQNHYY